MSVLPPSGRAGARGQNLLIDHLPPSEANWLYARAEVVDLRRGQVLVEADQPVGEAHFPAGRTVVSLLSVTGEGASVEAVLVGREGFTGLNVLYATDTMPWTVAVQMGGAALVLPSRILAARFEESRALRHALQAYGGTAQRSTASSVACSRFHPVEARLARWLLHLDDRAGRVELRITQELLAGVVGAQRPSVSLAMGVMQDAGLVQREGRGGFRIANRAGLERMSCECYQAVRAHERYLHDD